MSPRSSTKETMAQALGDFFSSSPNGMTEEVIEAFGRIVKTKDGILPPRVFLEAVEHSPVAISITDTSANILYVNKSFVRLTGYDQDEIIGKNQSILSYKVTPVEVYKDLWNHLLDKKTWNGVLINSTKSGDRYLADLTVAPILGMNGEASYYMAIHRDVTEVHELENKVNNQKVLIESVVDAAPVSIAMLDRFGKVLLDNQAYKKLIGDMRGEEPAAVFLTYLNDVIEGGFDASANEGRDFFDIEVEYDPGEGSPPRWFSCSGVWMNSAGIGADSYFATHDDRHLLLVASEITIQKQQQEQVRANALRALMAEQQLLHSVRETLSGALFQLQGPLNIVNAALKIMERREGKHDEPLYQALVEIMHTGEKVQDVIRNSIPRQQQEAMAPVNLNEVIRDVLDLSTERMLKEGVVIDWQISKDLPVILGLQYGLRSAFKQLIDNAITALNEPGCKRREIVISTAPGEDHIELVVRDTGPGIPAEKRISIFEPFNSEWVNSPDSSGMGLTIAQEVALQHGGYIEIDPSYTDGCLMRLGLPLKVSASLLTE